MLTVIFLGTSGSMPTPTRGLPSIAIRRGNELLLFDCGEGAQTQMFKAKVGFMRKTSIFITHVHGDHVLGMPGIFQTMSLLGRKRGVDVYGPPEVRAYVKAVLETVKFGLTFSIDIHEVREEGTVCARPSYRVDARWVDHGELTCLAYALVEEPRPGKFNVGKAKELGIPQGPLWRALQRGKTIVYEGKTIRPDEVLGPNRPGRRVAYTGDTRPCRAVAELAKGADVLIHDATFDDDLSERAWEAGHSTSVQAAKVAKKVGVKRLYLFHISPRYRDPEPLVSQAREIFPDTWLPDDLDKVEVPLPK